MGLTTATVLLAAGAGTRFDHRTPKLLAELRGRPLIAWAVDSARASGLPGPYIVTGAVDLSGAVEGGAFVRNDRWSDGMASSLQVGVAAAKADGHDAIVVALGDQPAIAPGAWRAVAAATQTPIAVATYSGKRAHPVRLGSSIWDALPSTGDEGARLVMRERPELVTEVPCSAGNAHDIDTAEELDRFNSPTRFA